MVKGILVSFYPAALAQREAAGPPATFFSFQQTPVSITETAPVPDRSDPVFMESPDIKKMIFICQQSKFDTKQQRHTKTPIVPH